MANLGHSISKAKSIDFECTTKHINLIKNDEPNTRRGSIYEIIFAAAFHNPPKQVVELLHPQAPTYDLIVHLQDGSTINISVKNFGDSERDLLFTSESKNIEDIITKFSLNPTQVFISNDTYPSKMDWDNLRRKLPRLLQSSLNIRINVNEWSISLIPLNTGKKKFYSAKSSYTVFITAQFHPAEESRLYKYLKKACSDIEKNGVKETDDMINILCIHIPAYVVLEDYVSWCKNYLQSNPDTMISGMRLIQPALAVDPVKDRSFLAFSYRDIFKEERLKNWFSAKNRQLNGEFAVGIPSTELLNFIFNPSGDHSISKKHYIYQSGHIYYLYDESENGSIEGNARFDYGIHTHAVMRLFKEDTIWSGKFPPTSELLIL